MNTFTRRVMRLALTTVGLAGLLVAVNAVPGAATPPVGFSNQVLARGTYVSHETLPLRHGLDIVVSKITVAPGGTSGWHSHPGGAIIVVQQGAITIYASAGKGDDEKGQGQEGHAFPHCVITTYTRGQSFVELPGQATKAVNNGSVDFVLLVTFPDVPVGGSSRIDEPNPGTCPV
jgi:quercetin dioxygenase-like cupin family protein